MFGESGAYPVGAISVGHQAGQALQVTHGRQTVLLRSWQGISDMSDMAQEALVRMNRSKFRQAQAMRRAEEGTGAVCIRVGLAGGFPTRGDLTQPLPPRQVSVLVTSHVLLSCEIVEGRSVG